MNPSELANDLDTAAELELQLNNPENWADLKKAAETIRQLQKQLDLHKNAHHEAVEICRQQHVEIEALKVEKEKLFMSMLDMALDAEMKDLKNDR